MDSRLRGNDTLRGNDVIGFGEVNSEFVNKTRGDSSQELTSYRSVTGVADTEVFLGAGYADEKEATLFFGFIIVIEASFVREQAFFDADDK